RKTGREYQITGSFREWRNIDYAWSFICSEHLILIHSSGLQEESAVETVHTCRSPLCYCKKYRLKFTMEPIIKTVEGGTYLNDLLLRSFNNNEYVRIIASEKDSATEIGKGCFLPKRFLDIERQIREMEVREDDIWVVTFPKSGTTWAQEMVWCLCNNLDFDEAKSTKLPIRFPFLEFSAFMTPNDQIPEALKNSVDYVKNLTSPRYIKTHLPWELLPQQLKTKKPKIIYVARNPKDVCVSFFHQVLRRGVFSGSLEDMADLFLGDNTTMAPFWDHILTFWNHRKDSNILFITYEDMKKDLPSIVNKVNNFLEKKPLTPESLSKICSHLSFESMKENHSVNYKFWKKEDVTEKSKGSEINFMRKGKVGSWKEEMKPEIWKRFDRWTEENLRDSDFSFSS
ncbi:hypothetical protein J437_LFUL001218, partial [Ladona fulva]